jgi:hypothetical protein
VVPIEHVAGQGTGLAKIFLGYKGGGIYPAGHLAVVQLLQEMGSAFSAAMFKVTGRGRTSRTVAGMSCG